MRRLVLTAEEAGRNAVDKYINPGAYRCVECRRDFDKPITEQACAPGARAARWCAGCWAAVRARVQS